MSRKVSTAPKGFRTVTPVLTVAGAASAIDFYAYVFGAEEGNRIHGEDGLSVVHSELKIGNSMLIVSDENPALGIHSPVALGASPVAVHLYLDNVDSVWERAIEAGATVVVPMAEVYWGERFGKIVDPYGHVWSLSKRIENLSADEIASRAAALSAPAIMEPIEAIEAIEAVEVIDIVDINEGALPETVVALSVADSATVAA